MVSRAVNIKMGRGVPQNFISLLPGGLFVSKALVLSDVWGDGVDDNDVGQGRADLPGASDKKHGTARRRKLS